ncbi:Syntaxin-like protein psy1 [Smittium culicis]|uniref:Syntaxin-like protein psy1 n=2 Tax=Smittium culicis TaxID=133412 RepID=A0A1R1XSS2_9FUNG|nr:Syntaxin-like protein psy1 [Smittium culicis]OMJ17668.1 Syntaxin-like protein psy1 [Smittium culicis]
MSRDRFGEFQQRSGTAGYAQDDFNNAHSINMNQISGHTSDQKFFKMIDDVKAKISDLDSQTQQVRYLSDKTLSSINDQTFQASRNELELLNRQVEHEIKQTKADLEYIQSVCNEPSLSRTQSIARIGRHQALSKNFASLITKYQQIKHEFYDKSKMRLKRQFLIAKPNATEEEIDDAIENQQANNIFAQAVLNSNRSGEARRVLKDIEDRHKDILNIEKTINELATMFEQVSGMISEQQEMIDNIENGVEDANEQIIGASSEVAKAVVYRKKSRKVNTTPTLPTSSLFYILTLSYFFLLS